MTQQGGQSDGSRLIEAVLFAAEGPLTLQEIGRHAGLSESVLPHLAVLAEHYAGRGIELVERGFIPAEKLRDHHGTS